MNYFAEHNAFFEAEFSAALQRAGRKLHFGRGSVIYREGDDTGGLIKVLEGVAEVQLPTIDGEVVLAHLLWPGDWVGEGLVLTNRPRSRFVAARSDVEILHVPHIDLMRLLESRPLGWKMVGRIALHHQRMANRCYLDSAIRDPQLRCLAAILRLANSVEPPEDDFARTVPVSQEELGRMTNLCRNSTGKALGHLGAAGMVQTRYRQLEVPSLQAAHEYLRTNIG